MLIRLPFSQTIKSTDPFHHLFLKEGFDDGEDVAKDGRFVDEVESLEPHRECILVKRINIIITINTIRIIK